MPGQRVEGFPAIRSFPLQERYGFVWVWPGDKDKADPQAFDMLANTLMPCRLLDRGCDNQMCMLAA